MFISHKSNVIQHIHELEWNCRRKSKGMTKPEYWAWIETTAFHFHCSDFLGRNIHLEAGDDAKQGSAKWYDITPELISQMYASHGDYLRIVNDSFVKKWSFYDYFVNSIIVILVAIIAILLTFY